MAITCQSCYFAGNSNSAAFCQQCGATLGTSHQSQPSATRPTVNAPSAGATASAYDLCGTVTWLEQTLEQTDFDWYRFLSQLIIFLVALPLFIAIFAVTSVLWMAFTVLGFSSLSRDVSPFNMLNSVNSFGTLVAIILPRVPKCYQVSALRLTVHDSKCENAALIKGQLVSGTFRKGDDVQLSGVWKSGTLFVTSGFNKTLNTSIVLRKEYWNVVFWILMGAIFIIAFGLSRI